MSARFRLRRHGLLAFGALLVSAFITAALLAPWIAPWSPYDLDVVAMLEGPSASHPLGTDELGRDVLSRTIYAARISLLVATVAVTTGLVGGTLVGLAAAWFGGWVDALLLRLMELLFSFPAIPLAVILMASLGTSTLNAMIAMGIIFIPGFSRLARAVLAPADLDRGRRRLARDRPWRDARHPRRAGLGQVDAPAHGPAAHASGQRPGRDRRPRRLGPARPRAQGAARQVQVVFQDPGASFNPRQPVRDLLAAPLEVHGLGDRRDPRLERTLARVGLDPAVLERHPHQLSGGQKQRVGIARAIILEPSLLLLDEPTSALDVSVQAQVLNLFRETRAALGLTCLFVSHNLAVIRYVADRVVVMRHGRIVETGPAARVFAEPADPYTRALVAAVPDVARELRERFGTRPA